MARGIQAPHPPDLLARGSVVRRHVVGAEHDEHLGRFALVGIPSDDDRRGIALRRLLGGVEHPVLLPEQAAGRAIKRRQITRAGLHHGDDHSLGREHGRGAEIPPERVFAELLLQVCRPDDRAVGEVQGCQFATLIIDPDILAVGDGRRVAAGGFLVFARLDLAEFTPPDLLAVAIEADGGVFAVDRAGDDHAVAPHRRRTSTQPWQLHPPEHMVGRAPRGDIAFACGDTIQRRPAPVGPVVSSGRLLGKRGECTHDEHRPGA